MIYTLTLSQGTKVRIDDEDLKKLMENGEAFMVTLKQAIVRPPFVVSVTPTNESETTSRVEIKDGIPHRVGGVKKLADLMNPDKYKKLN